MSVKNLFDLGVYNYLQSRELLYKNKDTKSYGGNVYPALFTFYYKARHFMDQEGRASDETLFALIMSNFDNALGETCSHDCFDQFGGCLIFGALNHAKGELGMLLRKGGTIVNNTAMLEEIESLAKQDLLRKTSA